MKSKSSLLRLLGLAAVVPLLALGTTACDDDNDDTDTQMSRVRVIHLSPDAPGVDVWANGTARVVSDLAFGDSTGYLDVDAGVYDFDVSAAGSSAEDAVLSIGGASLMADGSYTAVAYDNLGSIQAILLSDSTSDIPSGHIRVRAIHTAAGVGEVDIWNIPSDGSAPAPLYENVGFGVAGDEVDLPEGAYTIGFDVDNDASPDLVFELPSLAAGTHANIFAVADSMGVHLVAQLPDGTTARVDPVVETPKTNIRVLHLSPDAGSVDVWANGAVQAVEGLGFPDGTGYLELDAGTYSFDITAAMDSPDNAVLTVPDLELSADTYYTAVAYNNAASIQAMALVDDYEGLAAGDIRVRAIHTAVGVGDVDIWEISDPMNPIPLFTDVAFGDVSGYEDLPAMAYTLGFDLDNDANPDVVFELPSLEAGTVANVFAATDAMGTPFLLAQFANGDTARVDLTP